MKLFISSITLALILLMVPSIGAQDFNQLLSAVDKLENSLKEMVTHEQGEREEAISQLQTEINFLRAEVKKLQHKPAGSSVDVSKFEADLNSLASTNLKFRAQLNEQALKIRKLSKNNSSGGSYDLELAQLSKQVVALTSELNQVRRQHSSDIATPGPVGINLSAADLEATGLEITGFFDVTGSHSTRTTDETNFGINQAELDLEHKLSEKATAVAAIAYNSDDTGFELAWATIDITLHSGEQFVNSLNFSAGQFDVPFGIDYKVYASPDRKLVTNPQATDETHGGWNDFGFQFMMDTKAGNLVVFAVNGFEESVDVLDEAASLAAGFDVFEEVATTPSAAFGTRLGFTPFSFLEFGGSIAIGLNDANENQLQMYGSDLQFSMSNFDLKGEFILHSHNRALTEENSRAYYLQGTYNILDRAFVTSRYGSFRDEGAEWNGHFSFGVGYALVEGVELRFETLIAEQSSENLNIFQLVAGF